MAFPWPAVPRALSMHSGSAVEDVFVLWLVALGALGRSGRHEREVHVVPFGVAELLVVMLDPIGPGRGSPERPLFLGDVLWSVGDEIFVPVRVLAEDRDDCLALGRCQPLVRKLGHDHVALVVPGEGRSRRRAPSTATTERRSA